MKKLLFAVLALIMASCSQEPACTTTSQPTGLDINITELTTRSLTSATTRLTCILTQGDVVVEQVTQQSGDSDYGTVHMNVKNGEYNLLIFANNAIDAYTVNNDGTISFAKCGDAYSYSKEVVVGNTKRETIEPTLKRCSSRLIIQSTDDMPQKAEKIRIQVSNISTTYDIAAGVGANTTEYDTGVVGIRKKGNKLDIFTNQIIPDESADCKVTTTIYDNEGNTMNQIVKTVTLKKNVQTTLSGAMLISTGSDATITIDETWNDSENVEL